MKIKLKKILKTCVSQLIYAVAVTRVYFIKKIKAPEKTLLIIKIDAIGDYVLFRNFLKEIRCSSTYKDYKITFLGNKVVKDIAEALDKEFIDEFIWINRKELIKNPFCILRLINLVCNKFSVSIYASYSREFMGDLLIKLSGAKSRIGYYGDYNNISEKEKNKTDKWYTKLIEIDSKIFFEFYKSRSFFNQILNENIIIRGPSLSLKNVSVNTPDLPTNFVVLFPGSSASLRQWPAKNFRLVAKNVINKYNLDIVICGSKEDTVSAGIINNENNTRIHDFTGKTNLMQTISIISNAKLIISNDTSGAHIGPALDIPTIVISKLNHYLRFVPYPKELNDMMICIIPKMFENISQEVLAEKFKYGPSEVDISLVPVNDVEIAAQQLLKNKIF